ncbi:MAG TPA: hypothetical protein VGL35_03370 [Rhizomicrobium sp.]|jgi:hypothetical protein
MYRSILLSAAAIAWMAGSVAAQASCGAPLGGKAGVIEKLPHIKLSPAQVAPRGYGSIVGMWTNSLIVQGNVVATSITTWHSDGTEFDNIDAPPIEGNICQGVWESRGVGKVQEHHFGWTFDQNSNPSGYFTLEQTLKLTNHGMSYSGPFDQKYYDNDGNLLTEVMGEMSAQRFTGQ